MLQENNFTQELFSRVPVEKENKTAKIQECQETMTGKGNVLDMFSLNRYLPEPIKSLFSLSDAIVPITTLLELDMAIAENKLNFGETLDLKETAGILENYNDIGTTFLYEKIVNGQDIRDKKIGGKNDEGEERTLGDMFDKLVMTNESVRMGDELPLNTLFSMFMILMEYKVAEENINLLNNDSDYIYQLG